ncbi:GH92 family glycosyl hydrolase [Capnocytophaga canimorsus]|uniref:GH92 family glycosyl hydrolase n=1 Tax=Capnocytophaga canimorsus TaxID=28188 RepID=UPI001ACD61AD|nr:GH92 family glycosyl hydrolase [Capnocytophaga canimorsus]GIM58725.1 alpha-1 2-mannosidase [Capnocytophaga canimorsus]
MKKIFLALVGTMYLLMGCKKTISPEVSSEKLTDWVNPFIGTDGPGNTYPGATVPFGMIQLSPDIGIPGWDRIAGYFYQDNIISGFSHTHLTGTGAGDLYDILVMPTNSRFSERIAENSYKPFSKFNHQQEKATAGYYTVDLLSYGIKAELTATERVGVHRYTFPKDEQSKIHIDLGFAMNWDAPTDTHLRVVDANTIEGYRKSTGWAKDQRIFFVMQFSRPFTDYLLFEDEKQVKQSAKSKNTRIELLFPTASDEKIVVKTAISTANIEGAYASMQTEATDFNFENYVQKAQQLWENELQKIQISTNDPDKKTIFYTMMYQSMLAPTLLSDPNGYYKAPNGNISKAENYNRYDTFSLWDTFRAAHPLYTIIQREKSADFIKSLLAHYQETGKLPVWSMQGNETNMMIGYHSVPVIVDAYFKGIPMDTDLAYQACVASAMVDERQIDLYKKLGYVPTDEHHENWSVSKTVEYAYGDWCIAMFAKALNKNEDYQYFLNRSENWKNHYDTQSTFLRPKDKNGKFVSPFVAKEYTPYFCESNAWHYFWFVPQNVPALIQKTGGKERFEQKLDSMFTLKPLPEDKLPIFSTGMIGQYAHGNEPSHHVGYLYNYVGKPSKTQSIIQEIMQTQYRNTPDGHCGNEDCGQMSSWFIMSSLGFYPVNSAQGVYLFGTPFFEQSVIDLGNKKTFTIKALNFSEENQYIQAIKLNGVVYKKLFISHKDILQGGELVFEMGNTPNDVVLGEYELPEPEKVY